jgi:thiamine pyrophosphate-dependent acetolactate synthase large subunit-like protein
MAQAAQTAAAQAAVNGGPVAEARTIDRPGSDFMMDVFKSIGFDYVFANPGGSFGGLHESIVNYCSNKDPEFITCMHEESSVAMAHGYAKVEGKPVLTMAHGTVGLQHAAMALYNAWCDRVPVYLVIGNSLDVASRGGEVAWVHSVQDAAAMVRDFVKWDDTPASLQHFAESAIRAYKVAMTPPRLPVVLVADTEMQDNQIPAAEKLSIPKLTLTSPPAGDAAAVAEAAKMLVAADNPVIVAGRAASSGSAAGLGLMVELAEALQAGVIDQYQRLNFPSHHRLNQSLNPRAALANADLVLALEPGDLYGTLRPVRQRRPLKVITITAADLYLKSNYQDFQRFNETDLAIAADAEATLPSLIEAIKRLTTADRRIAFEARGAKLAEAGRQALEQARVAATYGWDASPITTARLTAEVWAQVKNEDWSYASEALFVSNWPLKLWDMNKHYHYIGGKGGAGIGYGAPATLGAAVANKKHGRFTVNIQTDGDMMYAPGVLWTASHHRIPILTLMHNNRAYHQEVMGIQGTANRRGRGIDRIHIGTKIDDPFIDYAKLAQSMGVRAEGSIADPKDLGPAIQRGVAAVKRGEPYLIDVVTQGR